MVPEIVVVAEHNGSELDPITFDLLAWGSQIAKEKHWKLGAMAVGAGIDAMARQLRNSAADVILALDDPSLREFNSLIYSDAIAAVLTTTPRLILLGHSYVGIELSGGLARKLDATLWTNCQALKPSSGGYRVTRPIAGGTFGSTLEVEADACNVFSLQRGSAFQGDVAIKEAEIIKLAMPPVVTNAKIKVTGETKATFAEDITKADLLVSVGRGIGHQNQLAAYQDLARLLGGSIAASRPIVDSGWLPVDNQVGLSGRTVRPKVYIACGISGSMQHLAGMRDSRLIIAINQDANAPIFQVAHYGIVGDISIILPALTNQAKISGKNAISSI